MANEVVVKEVKEKILASIKENSLNLELDELLEIYTDVNDVLADMIGDIEAQIDQEEQDGEPEDEVL